MKIGRIEQLTTSEHPNLGPDWGKVHGVKPSVCPDCERVKAELVALLDTNRRLNRRCQTAEAAANLKVEEWDKRSAGQGRGYIFESGKRSAFRAPHDKEALTRWIVGALRSFVAAHGSSLESGLLQSAAKRIAGAICSGLESLESGTSDPAVVTPVDDATGCPRASSSEALTLGGSRGGQEQNMTIVNTVLCVGDDHVYPANPIGVEWVCGCGQKRLQLGNSTEYDRLKAQKDAIVARQSSSSEAGLIALVAKAIPLLRAVRTLDCGAHYCRYCPAKSPAWEHAPSCPYVASQQEYTEARKVADELATLLAAQEPQK